MNFTTTDIDLPTDAPGVVFDLGGLYAEFEKLTDKRKARGKRYGLALILLLFVLAKLCGEDRPSGVAQWLSERASSLIAMLDLSSRRLPSHNTFRRALQRAVNLGQLQKAVRRFLSQGSASGCSMLVAMDGKTLRGSFTPERGRAVQLLAAYLPQEGVVLMQVAVADGENELSAAPRLLRCLDLRGKVLIADALFTQRELSVQVVAAGGDYIWLAKDNQLHVREAIAQLFVPPTRSPGWGIPPDDFETAKVQNKGHGRLEERILTNSELLNHYLDWPHLAQVFKLERRRTKLKDGTQHTEVVYGLTSLNRHKANAACLLSLVRDYWGIENGLFHRRDATLHEDAIRMTHSTFAQAMAIFNNLAIGLILQHGWRYLPQARRHYNANPQAALALLLQPPG
jgi:predicted transposase YbfD/YdcC